MSTSSATVNLRTNAIESSSQSNAVPISIALHGAVPSSNSEVRNPYTRGKSPEHSSNEKNFKPMILQKMLQAPLGTNLGAMARLEANQMWSGEHYHSSREFVDNNSDTITADSESNDDNWDERTDYCNIIDNNRTHNFLTEHNLFSQYTQEQMINLFQNQNGFQQSNDPDNISSNIQEHCQSWVENNADFREPMDYVETSDSSRIYGLYSTEVHENYQFQTNESLPGYEQNHSVINQSEISCIQVQDMGPYYNDLPTQEVQPFHAQCYEQTSLANVSTKNAPYCSTATQQFSGLLTQDFTHYSMYSQEPVTPLSRSSAEHLQHSMYHLNQFNNQPPFHVAASDLVTYSSQTARLNTNPHLATLDRTQKAEKSKL